MAALHSGRAELGEAHVRRGRDGKLNAYVCEDRVGGRVILAQKLPELASYCTELAGSEKDQAVTLASLYQILKVRDGTGRTGGVQTPLAGEAL